MRPRRQLEARVAKEVPHQHLPPMEPFPLLHLQMQQQLPQVRLRMALPQHHLLMQPRPLRTRQPQLRPQAQDRVRAKAALCRRQLSTALFQLHQPATKPVLSTGRLHPHLHQEDKVKARDKAKAAPRQHHRPTELFRHRHRATRLVLSMALLHQHLQLLVRVKVKVKVRVKVRDKVAPPRHHPPMELRKHLVLVVKDRVRDRGVRGVKEVKVGKEAQRQHHPPPPQVKVKARVRDKAKAKAALLQHQLPLLPKDKVARDKVVNQLPPKDNQLLLKDNQRLLKVNLHRLNQLLLKVKVRARARAKVKVKVNPLQLKVNLQPASPLQSRLPCQ